MNKIWKTTKTAAAYTAGAGIICAFFVLLGLALFVEIGRIRGQRADTIAADAAVCATDWECEQCGAACENPDYEEETF